MAKTASMTALAKLIEPDPAPALSRLLSESALAHAALGACAFPLVILDAAQVSRPVSFVNPAFERFFGYRKTESLGHSLAALVLRGDEPLLHRLLAESAASRWQLRAWARDGALRYVELAVGAVRSPEGRVTHWVLGFSDRSDIERLRGELEALKGTATATT
jgi:PAS domain S-box-containing protein